jgi:hypothetical protein
MSQTRRLAAILAADVAGYSRLMGADEEGTLERLKALRCELLDPTIAEHRGRIVKTTGDGLLVEFASVVDAVRCAVAVQQAMPERNAGAAADSRIELRIGINLGDVIVAGDGTCSMKFLFLPISSNQDYYRQAIAAVREYERRPGAGVLRRWHGRGDHHCDFAAAAAGCDRAQFEFHVQGQGDRRDARCAGAGRALRA